MKKCELTVRIRELSEPNVFRFISYCVFDWFAVFVGFYLALEFDNLLSYLLLIICLGPLQHAIGVLGHEGAHFRVHRNRTLNDLISNLFCFWPFGFDVKQYRRFHLLHHQYTGSDRDPEVMAKQEAYPVYDQPTNRMYIAKRFAIDLIGFGAPEFLRFVRRMSPIEVREVIGPLIYWIALFAILYELGLVVFVPIWFVALLTSFWAFFRLRIWTEHHQLGIGTHRTRATRWQRILFLPHNIGYHYEHHKWPSVVFWNLPKARNLDKSVEPIWVSQLVDQYEETGK